MVLSPEKGARYRKNVILALPPFDAQQVASLYMTYDVGVGIRPEPSRLYVIGASGHSSVMATEVHLLFPKLPTYLSAELLS